MDWKHILKFILKKILYLSYYHYYSLINKFYFLGRHVFLGLITKFGKILYLGIYEVLILSLFLKFIS